jgi:hypothetical protein
MRGLHSLYLAAGLAVMSAFGCDAGKDAPKIPLNQPAAGEAQTSGALVGEAKAALDSGNILFRARAYDRALERYRRSSQLAPSELAPLLGILMVADVTKDTELRKKTMPLVRALNPAAQDTAAAVSHGEMFRSHPPIGRDSTPLPKQQ